MTNETLRDKLAAWVMAEDAMGPVGTSGEIAYGAADMMIFKLTPTGRKYVASLFDAEPPTAIVDPPASNVGTGLAHRLIVEECAHRVVVSAMDPEFWSKEMETLAGTLLTIGYNPDKE